MDKISELAFNYGGRLHRQSDRNFPRTKFGNQILNTAKKSGHEYAGILLSLLLSIISDRGREILFQERKIVESRIEDEVLMLELILGMEEWIKSGHHTREEINKLPYAINRFIDILNITCQCDGMGTRLIKNHLLFHMTKYMEFFGPPNGWNSAPNETHHKTEIKAP